MLKNNNPKTITGCYESSLSLIFLHQNEWTRSKYSKAVCYVLIKTETPGDEAPLRLEPMFLVEVALTTALPAKLFKRRLLFPIATVMHTNQQPITSTYDSHVIKQEGHLDSSLMGDLDRPPSLTLTYLHRVLRIA